MDEVSLHLVFILLALRLEYEDNRVHKLPFLLCDRPVVGVKQNKVKKKKGMSFTILEVMIKELNKTMEKVKLRDEI